MRSVVEFLKTHKKEFIAQISLILVAACFLLYDVNRPLVDYDEATYAKVIVDTVNSGDISTFKLFGNDWFEKPPLYLWLAIGTVKIFGVGEFAFRLPSIFLALVCLWLVYLTVKELTDNRYVASAAYLILLFSPPFFVFSREARLDSGVIVGILAALFFCIKGWKKEKFLFWIFPALAIGFLFKSVIVFLAGPILLVYSLTYKEWAWLKSKYLWIGLVVSFVMIGPWHIVESIRFGSRFWNDYFMNQVFQRSISTITGTNNYYDYLRVLWLYYTPWLFTLLALIITFVVVRFNKVLSSKVSWRQISPPFICGLLIIILFTIAKTHLSTYILPAFPFFAMFIGLSFFALLKLFDKGFNILAVILLILLSVSVFKSFSAIAGVVPVYNNEQMKLGRIYAESQAKAPATLYAMDWPYLESLAYYGNVRPQYLDPRAAGGTELKAPFYMMTTTNVIRFFFKDPHTPWPGYENLHLVYVGDYLVMVYSDQDFKLPEFK